MIGKSPQRASLLVLLELIMLHSVIVSSLSISSSNSKNTIMTNSGSTNRNNQQQNSVQQLAQKLEQITTVLPPLITTITQNSYLDTLVQQQQQLSPSNMNQNQQDGLRSGSEQRSNNEDHDEAVPLATVNNHSRNNQPAARPPQYVDVSALVGRNSSNSNSLANESVLLSSGASGLTAKSRSGLPECATQQVCNAIFVRMNYTQKLCECSSNYNWKCSNNLDPQDGHTIELTRKFDKRIYTQIKTCEPLREVRACKSPTDWTLLALQSERSGKAHYVVVCKCPTWAQLEGPYTHNHPPYANIPGIRVYGMLCAHQTARSSAQTYATYNPALSIYPEFPWSEALNVLNTTSLLTTLDHH